MLFALFFMQNIISLVEQIGIKAVFWSKKWSGTGAAPYLFSVVSVDCICVKKMMNHFFHTGAWYAS